MTQALLLLIAQFDPAAFGGISANDIGGVLGGLSPIQVMIAYFIFNCAIQAMPSPNPGSAHPFYLWFFGFTHLIAGNLSLIAKEAQKRTLIQTAIQGTGDGTVSEKREAVEAAKQQIIAISTEKLEKEVAVPEVQKTEPKE